MSEIAEMLSFMTNYDFLNLGWGPLELTALYIGVAVVLIVAIIIIAVKIHKSKTKEDKFNKKLLEQWREKRPDSKVLLKYWDEIEESDKEVIGELSRNNSWCKEYLSESGSKEESSEAFLKLWEYQGQNQEDLLKQLMKELADIHIEQSMAACRLIAEIKDERSVPLLLLALLKMDKYPPARVAEALSAFGVVAARALAALYRKVEAKEYKLVILDAVSQLNKLCPIGIVKEAINSPDEDLRKKGAEVVGIISPVNGIELIRPLMKDPSGRIRSAAAAALSNIGGEEVYVILKEMMEKDPDWQVKSTCQTFVSAWENAIHDRVAFDEVDQWLEENTIPAEDLQEKKNA